MPYHAGSSSQLQPNSSAPSPRELRLEQQAATAAGRRQYDNKQVGNEPQSWGAKREKHLPVGVTSGGGAPLSLPAATGRFQFRGQEVNAPSPRPRATHRARPAEPEPTPPSTASTTVWSPRKASEYARGRNGARDLMPDFSILPIGTRRPDGRVVDARWEESKFADGSLCGDKPKDSPRDHRRKLTDLFPDPHCFTSEMPLDRFGYGGWGGDCKPKCMVDLESKDALTQLMNAQAAPRTNAQKAKARREIEGSSWDTTARTPVSHAAFSDPHGPGRAANSNGIDPRAGAQATPREVLAKKERAWQAGRADGYISTPRGFLASETASDPLPLDMSSYAPPPAMPGHRPDIYNGDYKRAARENPQWHMAGRTQLGHHGYR